MNKRWDAEDLAEKIRVAPVTDLDIIASDILPYRQLLFEKFPDLNYRPAAVLAMIYPKDGEAHTAMILRKTYDGVHSGQMAFPGGKKEDSDPDLWHTALRESMEEVGVDAGKVRFVRQLPEVKIPVSGFVVTPFVGLLQEEPKLSPDISEVERVVEIPWRILLDQPWKTIWKTYESKAHPVKCLHINDCEIWGATALVVEELRRMINGEKFFL